MAHALETKQEIDLLREKNKVALTTIETVGGLVRHGFTMGTLALIAYQMRLALVSLAGKTTVFNSNVVWTISATVVLSVGFGAYATAGWLRANKLRKQTVGELTGHITALEEIIDPNRKSSGLDIGGAARKRPKKKPEGDD
jgi:hypothetical protein